MEANPLLNRHALTAKLIATFAKALDESIMKLTWEEQADFIESLLKLVKHRQEKKDQLASEFYMEAFVKKYKDKLQPAIRLNLFKYLDPELSIAMSIPSAKEYNALAEAGKSMNDGEFTTYLNNLMIGLLNKQQFHYLYPRHHCVDEPTDVIDNNDEEDAVFDLEIHSKEKEGEEKEFTLRRKILFMYFLDKHYRFNVYRNSTSMAKLLRFLTGASYDSIYKMTLNPYPKGKKATITDLRWKSR